MQGCRKLAILLTGIFLFCPEAGRSAPVERANPPIAIQRAFHLVGIPGVKRNGRVDVKLTTEALVFLKDQKEVLSLPYARVRRMQVLDGTRTYGKATYASVLAFGLPGLIVLTKKSHVDTLVLDYVNERGGQMGLVIQVPAGTGGPCRDWLLKHGVQVEEPEPLPKEPLPGSPQ